jgi:hypothetical protein
VNKGLKEIQKSNVLKSDADQTTNALANILALTDNVYQFVQPTLADTMLIVMVLITKPFANVDQD